MKTHTKDKKSRVRGDYGPTLPFRSTLRCFLYSCCLHYIITAVMNGSAQSRQTWSWDRDLRYFLQVPVYVEL